MFTSVDIIKLSLEVYYNRKKRHSQLGYVSPEAFEAKNVAWFKHPWNPDKINPILP